MDRAPLPMADWIKRQSILKINFLTGSLELKNLVVTLWTGQERAELEYDERGRCTVSFPDRGFIDPGLGI